MRKFFAAMLAVFFVAYLAINNQNAQRKFLYPFPYRDKVERHAARYKVDKFLAVSVMKVESNFAKDAMSRSGAIGLMQIMPETAAWIACCLDDDPPSLDELHDSDKNIRYGIWYLSELEYEFGGNDVLALAAYNAGRGNVNHWIEKNGWSKDFSDVDAIPFDETRKYVKRVLECKEKYSALYGAANVASKPVEPKELRFASLRFFYD